MIINNLKNKFLNKNKEFNNIYNLNLENKPSDIYIMFLGSGGPAQIWTGVYTTPRYKDAKLPHGPYNVDSNLT